MTRNLVQQSLLDRDEELWPKVAAEKLSRVIRMTKRVDPVVDACPSMSHVVTPLQDAPADDWWGAVGQMLRQSSSALPTE